MLKKYRNKLVALHWMTVPLISFSLMRSTFFYTISAVTLTILEVLQKQFLTRFTQPDVQCFLGQSHFRSGFSFIPNLQ